jgi:hypothetical protein
MIERLSKLVPFSWSTEYFWTMLKSMSSFVQLFGGPLKYLYTAGRFHRMPPVGTECSWTAPIAWPNSWRITRRYSSSSVSGVNHPKFIVGSLLGNHFRSRQSVPIADHDDPGSNSKETRISDLEPAAKSRRRLA